MRLSQPVPIAENETACWIEKWLWYPYLPMGTLTLLHGESGVGKSFVATAIAALVTSGTARMATEAQRSPSSVLLIGDGEHQSVIPFRFAACSGNAHKAFMTTDPGSMDRVIRQILRLKPALVIVDPFEEFLLGKGDTDGILRELCSVALETHCAVLLTCSCRRWNSSFEAEEISLVERVSSVLRVEDPRHESGVRAVVHEKCILAPRGKALGFKIDGGRDWVKFEWCKPERYSDDFRRSYRWRELRVAVLKKYGPRCQCCGASREHGVRIDVDHIKPYKFYPELALVESNLQVLCEDCNLGKGTWDETDWRGTDGQVPEIAKGSEDVS